MKLPDFNISDRLHRRWCSFLLHRYLGQFLDQRIPLDQLSVNLSDGKVSISDVNLNVTYINELLSSMNLPLRVIDGYIGHIAIDVPWSAIISSATTVRVESLQLTFQAKDSVRLDKEFVSSMIGSVVESLVSSRELAKSFCEHAETQQIDSEVGPNGISSFTKVIDALVSRFCLELTDTIIRLENMPKNHLDMCTALEVRLGKIEFMDEQLRQCRAEGLGADAITAQPQGIGSIADLNKFLFLSGVELYTDVFSRIDDRPLDDPNSTSQVFTSMYMRREKMKQKSPSQSPEQSMNADLFQSTMSNATADFQSCYSHLGDSQATISEFKIMAPEPDLCSNPVKIAEFSGNSQMIVRIKNGDGQSFENVENKVEVELSFKGLHVFLTPSQVEILRMFFTSVVVPSGRGASGYKGGKQMGSKDYDAILQDMEDTNYQQSTQAIGMEGNWRQADHFQDFDNVSLDEKTNKSSEGQTGFKSIKSDNGKKERTKLKATVGTVLLYITHHDPLNTETAKHLPRTFHEAIESLQRLSDVYFSLATQLDVKKKLGFGMEEIRKLSDKLYSNDHIRFVGSGVSVTYQVESGPREDFMSLKTVVNNCDCVEFLTNETNKSEPERCHFPLLDFSESVNENHDPDLKIVLTTGGHEASSKIFLSPCKTEIDLSIVDRVCHLLKPRPFFNNPSYNQGNVKSKRAETLQLSEDLFSPNSDADKQADKSWIIDCTDMILDLRVPKADLRSPGAARLPYNERHVHPEFIRLRFVDVQMVFPTIADKTELEILASQLTGQFCGISPDINVAEEDTTFLYGGRGSIGKKLSIKLVYDGRTRSLKPSTSHVTLPESADDMTKSFSATVLQTMKTRDGPFSHTRRQFSDGEEDIIEAGSRLEMNQFAEACLGQSTMLVQLDIPSLRFFIANHAYLEILYNRLVNDLALWQPAAPILVESELGVQINAPAEQFHEVQQERSSDEEEEESGDELFSLRNDEADFDRLKPHTFSFVLNTGKINALLGTVVLQNNMEVAEAEVGLELNNSQLFAVVGFHGQLEHMFFHFTTNTASVGHRSHDVIARKGRMNRTLEAKEFGKWSRDETQLETLPTTGQFCSKKEDDAIAIAMHMHTRADINVKDVLLALSVRSILLRMKPFHDFGHLWATQLSNLFCLQDYEIPGYELPLVSNDLQLSLNNVVVGYDHNVVKPESGLQLRLVLGQTNITSSIVRDMNVSKFICILERTSLHMREEMRTVRFDEEPTPFILLTDVGLFHLEVMYTTLDDSQMDKRQTPLVGIRCKNDIIKAWLCADSLAALINIVSELSESEEMKPVPLPEVVEEESELPADELRSEACGSTWSKAPSILQQKSNTLPHAVEHKLQAMVMSAMKEREQIAQSEGIALADDPLEDYKELPKMELLAEAIDETEQRTAAYSMSTDDEFTLVDDFVGSGVANAGGQPKIKYIGKDLNADEVITIDALHYRLPDDWKMDGLGSSPETGPPPLIRYMIKDVSIELHIFGGSDLSSECAAKPYSAEEYRSGLGKGQTVAQEARGGLKRDHSVSIVVCLNKINFLYQMFNKDAPAMCTTLFSIYDIIIQDRLTLSNIKELLYQYSNSEQPRRTCAPMLAVRIVESHSQEGRMRISLLPVKLNVDQDTLNFLEDLVAELTESVKLPKEVTNRTSMRPRIEVAVREDGPSPLRIPQPTLNMEPLTPSPVNPLSPIGDLSYLAERGSNLGSPVKRPLPDAPLTSSAVSIGNLFGTNSRLTNRTFSPDDRDPSPNSCGSDLLMPSVEEEPDCLQDNLFENQGDWKNSNDDLSELEPSMNFTDDLLARSTMEGSFHPDIMNLNDDEDGSDGGSEFGSATAEGETSTIGDNTERCADDRKLSEHEAIQTTTFFKSFVFSPPVAIYVDYHGKNKINMEKGGAMLGVLKGIGQLNRTEVVLKEIHYSGGLLGVGRCLNYAVNEWADDIMTNIPNVLASCGPISPLVQIGKGVMDLFWLPVAELRRDDGHVVKGLQKGVGSFGLSSAAGIVGIAQTVVGAVQTVAEAVLYEVQPEQGYLNRRNRLAIRAGNPTDLRHGMQLAYRIVSDGVRETKDDLELAAQEDRASGQSSIRSVLRFATPAMIRPIVMGSKIGYNLLGGLRNQLRPDMYQDERHKWRDDEVPGSS